MQRLSTACQSIDRLLGGGLPVHQLTLAYGEASTGKTILAMQSAIQAAQNHFRVFYVDGDLSFSPRRLEQLPGGVEEADKIVVFTPESFRDQVIVVENIEGMLTRTGALLVIDSITGLYRTSDKISASMFVRNRELNRQIAYLKDLAARFQLWVLLTGQVHSAPAGRQWLMEPVATRTLKHWSDNILGLRLTARSNVRECVLEKSEGRETGGERTLFRIGEDGMEDL